MQTYVRRTPRTSFGTGGPAFLICDFESGEEELHALELADRLSLPVAVLGEGTNVLLSDAGWPGVVIRPVTDPAGTIWPRRDYQTESEISVKAYPSAVWDQVAGLAVKEGWPGAECLSGIPGTVGAAPVQNIGAYGQQVSEIIESVTAVDIRDRRLRTFTRSECGFGYRTSIFNRPENVDRFIITEVMLRFCRAGPPCRTYDQVAALTTEHSSLTDVRDVVLDIRRRKGMLAGQHRSAGSFFKNPVVPVVDYPEEASAVFLGDGRVKLSAAWLIERAGFFKGYVRGGAGISPDHTLALVSHHYATSADIVALAREIQERVANRFGIVLESEVRLIGFPDYPLLRP